eukprot:212315-Alexandrium_andersonii.AAC.1
MLPNSVGGSGSLGHFRARSSALGQFRASPRPARKCPRLPETARQCPKALGGNRGEHRSRSKQH